MVRVCQNLYLYWKIVEIVVRICQSYHLGWPILFFLEIVDIVCSHGENCCERFSKLSEEIVKTVVCNCQNCHNSLVVFKA